MKTRVVTDSSACLGPRLARRLGVKVVGIGIVFVDGTEGADDATTARRVERALMNGEPVKSVPPSVLEYLDAAEDDQRDSVVLTPATEFTVMYSTALNASRLGHRRMDVVDTRTAASAQGLVVEAAARAAAEGGPDKVLAAAADAIERVRLVAALENLDTLDERGLVPSPSLLAARRRGARPLFTFSNGQVTVVGDAGRMELGEALLGQWEAMAGEAGTDTRVFHAGHPAQASAVREALGAGTPPPTRFSPAMTIHTGPGLVGVAWLSA